MKKICTFAILILLILVAGIFFFTPWRNTPDTLFLIQALLQQYNIEETPIIVEEHRHDEQTTFVLYRPENEQRSPGIVLSLGIHPEGAEDENIERILTALAAQGFTVITVHSGELREALIMPEEIGNLVEAYQFLAQHPAADPERIGFMGLSVGASLAFLAAADESIRDDVRYVVFFAGLYDAKELIVEVLSGTYILNGQIIEWEPADRIREVVQRNLQEWQEQEDSPEAQAILEQVQTLQDRETLTALKGMLPDETAAILDQVSLTAAVQDVRAPLFILHGTQDTYIPHSHSYNLHRGYPGESYIMLSDRYGHQAPDDLTWAEIFQRELWEAVHFTNRLMGYMK